MMKIFIYISIFFISLFSTNFLISAEINDAQKALLESLPPDQRASILSKIRQADRIGEELEETFQDATDTLMERPERDKRTAAEEEEYLEKSKNWVYGFELFQQAPTTFAPMATMPVPTDYVLGPGDELHIEYFGSRNDTATEFIGRSGAASFPNLGPIQLAGLTFREAQDFVSQKVSTDLIGVNVALTLGELRTITVYVLGEAYLPGSYSVSALSSVTNALFVSGGVNEKGSVRNIEVRRNGKAVLTFDLYDLLLKGNANSDIRLMSGDVIFIPIIEKTARAEGHFRRPNLFELNEDDTIKDLISYAGGFTSGVTDNGKLELDSINTETKERQVTVFYASDEEKLQKKIKDGDSLKVFEYSSLEESSITLKGEVEFPGTYSIKKGDRLLDVLNRSGGFSDIAYSYGAVFTRKAVADLQKDSFERSADNIEQAIADALTQGTLNISGDLLPISALISRLRNIRPVGRLVIDLDPLTLKRDPLKNILVEDGDTIYVPKKPSTIHVVGEVYSPSTHTYESSISVKEYINRSGGFRNTADKSNLYVILPNGEAYHPSNRRFFARDIILLPGSSIVVPRDPRPFDWLVMTRSIAPILANLATSAAALAAIE